MRGWSLEDKGVLSICDTFGFLVAIVHEQRSIRPISSFPFAQASDNVLARYIPLSTKFGVSGGRG